MVSEAACRFTVPCCPSTNNLFRNVTGKGRVRTEHYKRWIEDAGWLVRSQASARPVSGRVRMLIEGPMKIDLDNIKPIPDLAKKLGLIEDDALIDDLRIVRKGSKGDQVTVSIWPIA